MLAVATCPHRRSCRPDGRGYIVPEASHLTVASDACSGRVLVAEHQVMSSLVSHNSDLRNFVSQSKRCIKVIRVIPGLPLLSPSFYFSGSVFFISYLKVSQSSFGILVGGEFKSTIDFNI